jgi:hypothetical protein
MLQTDQQFPAVGSLTKGLLVNADGSVLGNGLGARECSTVVAPDNGRVALSVYSPIERTPGTNAFVLALDEVIGANSSRIKRGEAALRYRVGLRSSPARESPGRFAFRKSFVPAEASTS